jgi:hypothetical protein
MPFSPYTLGNLGKHGHGSMITDVQRMDENIINIQMLGNIISCDLFNF